VAPGGSHLPSDRSFLEILAFISLLALAVVPLMFGGAGIRLRAWLLAGAVALLAGAGAATIARDPEKPAAGLPGPVAEQKFSGSGACRSCHPAQYASWHATYHRTMTQKAGPQSVLAPFDDSEFQYRGRTYRFFRREDEYWVRMVDPSWELSQTLPNFDPATLPPPPYADQRILMTTGSHHLQVYWVAASHGNGMLYQVPWVYMIRQRRWIPAADSFLKPPPDGPVNIEIWNMTCIDCHSVGGQPRMEERSGTMFSRTAELGIACEMCHGPGEDHVRANRSIRRRYGLHLGGGRDPSVVQPSHSAGHVSAEICGQCHSVSGPADPREWMRLGKTYRPGQSLDATRRIVRFVEAPQESWLLQWLRRNPDALEGRFWSDGTVRVTGREYNGLIESACYTRGGLTCITCHSMHRSAPEDQLAIGTEGDRACAGCHAAYVENPSSHTHHAAGSSGSRCYNCHMPFTTYGLFSAIRSHRIDNPSVENSVRTGRPNACNLCHLDRTLAWTSEHLAGWYRTPPAELSPDDLGIAASVQWILKGDAAQRAITAWSMGWQPAQKASGTDWMAPYLAQLLSDPYSTVRFVADQALKQLPEAPPPHYDFLASTADLERAGAAVIEAWQRSRSGGPAHRPGDVLFGPDRDLRWDVVHRLLKERNNRPIWIIE